MSRSVPLSAMSGNLDDGSASASSSSADDARNFSSRIQHIRTTMQWNRGRPHQELDRQRPAEPNNQAWSDGGRGPGVQLWSDDPEFPLSAIRSRIEPPQRASAVSGQRLRQSAVQQQARRRRVLQQHREHRRQQREYQRQQQGQRPEREQQHESEQEQHRELGDGQTEQSLLRRPHVNPHSSSSFLDNVNDARERLEEFGTRLRSFQEVLGLHAPSILDPPGPDDADNSTGSGQHRAKRRKLEEDDGESRNPGKRYGHFGQVVPGRLDMEIVKCDGGEYGTDSVRLTCLANKYAAENILRDDNSVYCTKNPSCNLIFCHPHQIAFSVDHIVIDAPKRGYSAPVQQGLVYLSMTDDLLDKTRGLLDLLHQDAPRPGLPLPLFGLDRHHADEDEEEGDDDNDDDDDDDDIRATVNEEILSRYQRAMYGVENGLSRLQSFAQRMDGLADERAEERGALLSRHPHGSGSGAATWPLSETSDHHASHVSVYTGADGEQSSMDLSVATLRRVYGDMRRATQDHPSADDGSGSADGGAGRPQRASSRHGRGAHSLANERRSHRPRTRVRDGGAAHATSSAALGDDDSLLPYAVFHLAPRKSKVTIKFSPPVSCKYVLLQLRSPDLKKNIDIQTFSVFGYAGPRYFPSCQLR